MGKEGRPPVHRQIHEKLGTVYAFKSEFDAWWRERSAKLASKPENGEIAGAAHCRMACKDAGNTR